MKAFFDVGTSKEMASRRRVSYAFGHVFQLPIDKQSPVSFSHDRVSVVSILEVGPNPEGMHFAVTFPILFKRTSGVLNNTVPAGLLCSHGRHVHPSRVFLWSAVFEIGWHSPRPCVDCGKAYPYNQLTTPAAVAYYHPPRDQTSTQAKGLVIAIQPIMVFARFLRTTVVPPACTYALSPSS